MNATALLALTTTGWIALGAIAAILILRELVIRFLSKTDRRR